VPAGCLTIFLLFIAFVGSMVMIVFSAIKSTDLYKDPLARASLSIPISGPKGKGMIYVAATKSLGHWNYSGLVVEIEKTHRRIDLLRGPTPANQR